VQQAHGHHTGHDTGVDPRLNPTYRFLSAPSPPRTVRVDTHTLSVYMTVERYPETAEERRALVCAYGPYLVQEWVGRGLPLVPLSYLVHRPGQLGPSEAQCVHRADQADALAREHGGVPVALVLSNGPVPPDLVVSQVSFDA
jgi:hypothetical protein